MRYGLYKNKTDLNTVIFEHYFISDHFKSDQHKLKISQGFLR